MALQMTLAQGRFDCSQNNLVQIDARTPYSHPSVCDMSDQVTDVSEGTDVNSYWSLLIAGR